MNTKRFILMLLVMLVSVTGAWAQDLHTHQFDANGICTVEDCGYNAKALVGFIYEIDNEEEIFGSSESVSTDKFAIPNLFDGDTSTKWDPCVGSRAMQLTVTAFFQTVHPVVINGYSFYCEGGEIGSGICVPMSWNLYGYNTTNHSWDLLDAVEDKSAGANCYNSYRFNNEEGKSYQYFKWEVTKSDMTYRSSPLCIKICEFTLDAQVTQHVHRYSKNWYSDDINHWHQCLVQLGECDALKKDITAHTHTTYEKKCDDCGHVNDHEHEWDVECRLCGLLHTHQFDANGICTVEGCGYNAKDLVGFIDEVDNEGFYDLGEYAPGKDNDMVGIHNLFDGETNTMWVPCIAMPPGFFTVMACFQTRQPVVVNGYSFYCKKGSDFSNNFVPKSWNLYGYNTTSQSWDLLDAVEDNPATANQYNNYRFNNEEGKSYQIFKWEVTSTYREQDDPPCPRYFIQIGEFTLDIVNAQHEHSYSEYWSSDDTGHWHQCLNPTGICNAPKMNFTAHTHTAYSEKCDVCKHINAHEHEWDEDMNCTLCGPHTHQFDGNGVCTVENCGYNAKELVGFITEVPNESMLGDSRSTDKIYIKNLFDGDTGTKWIPFVGYNHMNLATATAIFQTSQPVVINGYSFYCDRHLSANEAACLPKSWNLYGYNMATESWELLDMENNQEVAENHYNNYRFKNEGDKSYQYFKWEVNDINYKGATTYYRLSIEEFTLDLQHHTHNYSVDFYYDETNHWHQCLSTMAACKARKIDFAAHSYTTYEKKCDVCGYTKNHEHVWDVEYGTCRLCGIPHTHVFDGNGVCTVENCWYDAKVNAGFMTEVEDEAIFGDSQSTNKGAVKNLFDRDADTKWTGNVCLSRGFKSTIIFKTQSAAIINGYSMCTYHVYPFEYRPQDWALYGYDEASSEWKEIHKVTDASPVDGWNNYRFANSEGASYSYFKLEITKLQEEHDVYKANIVELALDVQHEHVYDNHKCVLCGHADHVHRYSEEWSSNATGHWHQCLSKVGVCDAPKEDSSKHIHTIYEKKCDVCGYINTHGHEWDHDFLECRLCGVLHVHQFDSNGVCTTTNCGYDVKDLEGFIAEVEDETMFGDSQSSNKTDIKNLFDGDTNTRWTDIVYIYDDKKGTIIFKTQETVIVNGYSFCTYQNSRDYYYRPQTWTLYGYDEATSEWKEIHNVTDASPVDGWNNYRFVNSEGESYSYFKLEITHTYGNQHFLHKVNIVELTLDIHHEHNYELVLVDEQKHKLICTASVGRCRTKEIAGAHVYDETAEKGSKPYYTCSVCGYESPIRQHVHCYSEEWSSDSRYHWRECTSTVGTCIAPKDGESAHNIHASNTCDTENYMCDVCQYVNEANKAQFGERDYLSMTAVGGDVAVGFKKVGSPTNYTIQVSEDGNHWSESQTLTETATLATIPDGETYYFRHDATTKANRISSNDNNYWSFTMEGSGTIEAGGNIMSLLDATCQQTELPGSPQHVFTKLFFNCEKLTVAPRMDAITSVPQWGFVSMFAGSGIKAAPALSATSVPDGAYSSMFENCKELVSVPALPATKLNRCAYWNMFKGCDKLASIEIANIQSMVVEEGSSGRENSFHDMLAGTALETNGIIIAPVTMVKDTRITLPTNWQWATKLKANEDPTPGEEGNFYTTFYDSRYDYTVAEGHKAYSGIVASGDDDDELRLTPTPDNIIPKGNGVLLHGGSDEVLLTVSDEGASTIPGNVLTGSDENTPAQANCYILSYGQNGLGFYRYAEGKSLSAHKAYLTYQHGAGAQARALRMVFADDNEVDGIESISDDDTLHYDDDNIYSISGVRLDKLQKGINIVNGKKVIVK